MTTRINMWSGPRNLSTAMMYAWAQRADTTAVDEPLYAHYLRVTGADHPGRGDVLASQDTDGEVVVREVIFGHYDTPVVFFKQMSKHLIGLDRRFLGECRNVLLTRDPFDMLTSLQVQLPEATLGETGFTELVEILDVSLASGDEPIVVETKALLADPPGVLAQLCDRLDVPFDEAMLAWSAGPKAVDGVWAPHWYAGVHASTGWEPYRPKDVELLPTLEPVLRAAEPLYERLVPYRLT